MTQSKVKETEGFAQRSKAKEVRILLLLSDDIVIEREERNKILNTVATCVSNESRPGVDRLHERQDDREHREDHQAILDWLTPIDYAAQQNDFIRRRQEGTGEWLLKSSQFQNWVNQTKPTLFGPDISGAGKTMITSIVVDDLFTRFQNDASVGISYLYCNFRRKLEQKPEDLFTSILKQLIQGQPSTPESMKSLYERHKSRQTRPKLDDILKVLHSVVSNYSRTFVVIDTLDECEVSDIGRRRFLSEIFNLQAKTGASRFATSQFIPEFRGSDGAQ
ncbi:hypothetical protein V1506DRAFT_523541 [Lipomyces tetrasporus]